MAWSKDFQKCIFYHFLDNCFLLTFLLYNWILLNFCIFVVACSRAFQKYVFYHFLDIFLQTIAIYIKKLQFLFCNFFADSKSRPQELSDDVSFIISWLYPGFQVPQQGGGSYNPRFKLEMTLLNQGRNQGL